MLKNLKAPFGPSNRYWMVIVIASIAVFAAACGSALPTAAAPVNPAVDAAPTVPAAALPAQAATSAPAPAKSADICTLLPKDKVGTALGVTVDTAVTKGLGSMCTYTAGIFSVDVTVSHTGGIKYAKDTLAKLGDLALVVPGLGDQAFFNTNSISHSLIVLKGDAVYLISVLVSPTDPSQMLTDAEVQAKEKAVAEQLLALLP